MEEQFLRVPREGVSDDRVKALCFLVDPGVRVNRGDVVAEVETSKSVVEVEAHHDGFLYPLVEPGSFVDVGAPLARISEAPLDQPPDVQPAPATESADDRPLAGHTTISKKAAELMAAHGLGAADFPDLVVIRGSDVERIIGSSSPPAPVLFAGRPMDGREASDDVLTDEQLQQLQDLFLRLRKRLRAKFDRHVPMGTLLHDRWQLAKEYGFGKGASVYDESLILGDVQLGEHCWVGPFTVLDGSAAPLVIGEYSQVGTGSQIYTHNTIEHTLTGHLAPRHESTTRIGRCCFVSPLSMIGPGTEIGDHSFIAAGSYVQGEFPAFSYIAGNPGRRVGRVEIEGSRALLKREDASREV